MNDAQRGAEREEAVEALERDERAEQDALQHIHTYTHLLHLSYSFSVSLLQSLPCMTWHVYGTAAGIISSLNVSVNRRERGKRVAAAFGSTAERPCVFMCSGTHAPLSPSLSVEEAGREKGFSVLVDLTSRQALFVTREYFCISATTVAQAYSQTCRRGVGVGGSSKKPASKCLFSSISRPFDKKLLLLLLLQAASAAVAYNLRGKRKAP